MTGIFCPFVSSLLLPRLVSIPYPHYIWSQELHQGLLNSADEVLLLIPIMVRSAPWPTRSHTAHHLSPFTPYWQGCMIAKPQQDFPKSAEGALHTSPEWGECPFAPILEECLIAKPQEIFQNLQKEFCIHSPNPVNPLYVPILEECLAYAIAPPANRVHHPPIAQGIPYLDRVSMRHSLQWDTQSPFPIISLTSPEPTKH